MEEEEDYNDEEENPELEKEFKDLVEKYSSKINKKLKAASLLLEEAEELADKNGVPFYSSVSPIYNVFTPQTFFDKFSDLNYDLTEAGEYAGWEHSQIC